MDDIDRIVIEFEIGTLISSTVMDYKREGHDPAVVLSLIIASSGAVMAALFDDMNASDVKKVAGIWAKKGFLDANSLDLEV